jgi:four helix bundle protein
MLMAEKKEKSFTDLLVWKEGHKLVLMVYADTKSFPQDELFGLISQMRRSAVSITSNIAEGFSRQSYKEKVQFFSISLGSLTELQNQLLIAKDIGYLEKKKFSQLAEQSVILQKMMNSFVKKTKSFVGS